MMGESCAVAAGRWYSGARMQQSVSTFRPPSRAAREAARAERATRRRWQGGQTATARTIKTTTPPRTDLCGVHLLDRPLVDSHAIASISAGCVLCLPSSCDMSLAKRATQCNSNHSRRCRSHKQNGILASCSSRTRRSLAQKKSGQSVGLRAILFCPPARPTRRSFRAAPIR